MIGKQLVSKKEKKVKILLIIPAFNEEKSILKTIKMLKDSSEYEHYDIDYIVINDGSTDETYDKLRDNDINSINLVDNLGIGGAVQTGYMYALYNDYDIAIQFDGDGQHDIDSVGNLIKPIVENKADFVIGSRFVEDSPSDFKTSSSRRIGIKLISFFIKLVTGKRIYDVTSGYRAASRKVIKLFAKDYPVKYPEPESTTLLIKKNYRVDEVGVNMFERKEGKSSITPFKSIRYMVEVCTSIVILRDKGGTS